MLAPDFVYVPTGFVDLGVPQQVDEGLARAGFIAPFAIQTKAIPVALEGKDVCGRARTGSGKTLAFGVPMLARLDGEAEPRKPLGLVLVPTRELALQVADVLEPVAQATGRRGARRLRRRLASAADRRAEARCRRRRRHAAAAHRPVEGERDRPQRGQDRRPRRGRPDGRRRLHAAGRVDPAQVHGAAPDDAVLRDARRRRRPPRAPLHDGSRSRCRSTRRPTRSARCTTSSSRCTTWTRTEVVASIATSFPKTLVFCQTKRGCDRVEAGAAGPRRQRDGDPRRPRAGVAGEGAAQVHRRATSTCSSPPTSPHAASTSRTSAR